MDPNTTFSIARAPKRRSKFWSQDTITWAEVIGWMDTPADRKEAGNYLFGTLSGQTRGRHTIMSRSVLALDADSPGPDFLDKVDVVLPYECLIHTTYSSTPDQPRYRMLIPLSREVSPEEYEALADLTMRRIDFDAFDRGSLEAARYMFMPATSDPDTYYHDRLPGDPMDVDEELSAWDRDLSRRATPRVRKRDPRTLGGAVGAFNRVHTLETLVESYDLPYERAGDRWHLKGADAEAGMGEVDDGLYYSHHASDPAGGHAWSAFDLVRLHRFADLDDNVDEDTPPHVRPSHDAMLELAMEDEAVKRELVKADFDDIVSNYDTDDGDDTTAPDDSWKLGLSLAPRTGKMRDEIRNWDLIRDNDPVFKLLQFNEMSTVIESREDLPWRPLARGGEVFRYTDRIALADYLEREYGLRPSNTRLESLVDVTADDARYNPMEDYLLGLKWDGVERVETCLPGVGVTPYTRMVARKCLTAAVARVLEPGVKWDHVLVLYGDEGRGKTHWINRLSQGYSATLGPINSKDTLLAMQRSWIMVADEGFSLRKADSDAQKEFLTRTEDVYRIPYEREADAHPRRCVIWSTTNDEVFLRNQQGNRRFLIVHSRGRVNFDALTEEYVNQLWAEAVHLYKQGEPLFLNEEEEQLARDQREQYTEEDALTGIIQGWLDQYVPEDWEHRSSAQRRDWVEARDRGLADPGTHRINRVCSAELLTEALGGNWGNHSRTELLEVTKVLKRLPGWTALPGRHHVNSEYGSQLVFVRDGAAPSNELSDDFDIL